MKNKKVLHMLMLVTFLFIFHNCTKTVSVSMFEAHNLPNKEVGILYVNPSNIFQRNVEIQLYIDGKNSGCVAIAVKNYFGWRFTNCKIRVLDGWHHLSIHVSKYNSFFEFENILIEKGKKYNLGFSSLGHTEIMCTLLDTSESKFWIGVPRTDFTSNFDFCIR